MIPREILKKIQQSVSCAIRNSFLPIFRATSAIASLPLLICSCATAPPRPPDVSLNSDTLRDGMVIVNLRLDSGDDMPFLVDTGSPGTLFDKSLVSKLGRRLPIGSVSV